MTNDPVDRAQFIYDFLKGLPDTIKPEILLFVTMYGCDVGTMDEDEMWQTVGVALLETAGMKQFGTVLRMKAAIDYVLMRSLAVAHRNHASPLVIPSHLQPSDTVLRGLETMRLRGPLVIRHTEEAVARWKAFCSQHMNELDLINYEERLMRS